MFLGLFLWEERRSHHPILDVAFLVKNKAFALSTLASFINYSSIFGVTFYFSLYLQGVHGLTLLETGLLLSAQPAVQVYISPLGGRMADRHGADIIATIGIAVCGVGLLLASSLDGASSLWVVTLVQLVIGSGIALFASPNTSAIMTSVDEAHMGQASGLVGTARTLGTLSSMVIISLTMNAYLCDEALRTIFLSFWRRCTSISPCSGYSTCSGSSVRSEGWAAASGVFRIGCSIRGIIIKTGRL